MFFLTVNFLQISTFLKRFIMMGVVGVTIDPLQYVALVAYLLRYVLISKFGKLLN